MNTHLAYPMFAMVTWTFISAFFMFRSRVNAAKAGQIDPRYFKTFTGPTPPERVTVVSRHFTNLFEVPVLFYAGCVTAIALQIQSQAILILAWCFVATRLVHSYIHLGPNKLRIRVMAYFFNLLSAFALWCAIILSL